MTQLPPEAVAYAQDYRKCLDRVMHLVRFTTCSLVAAREACFWLATISQQGLPMPVDIGVSSMGSVQMTLPAEAGIPDPVTFKGDGKWYVGDQIFGEIQESPRFEVVK